MYHINVHSLSPKQSVGVFLYILLNKICVHMWFEDRWVMNAVLLQENTNWENSSTELVVSTQKAAFLFPIIVLSQHTFCNRMMHTSYHIIIFCMLLSLQGSWWLFSYLCHP